MVDADEAVLADPVETAEELEHQLEDDLVNVLTEEMDPRVTYREAVSNVYLRQVELVLKFCFAQRVIMTRADFILDLDQ